jgi:hypothetical protein
MWIAEKWYWPISLSACNGAFHISACNWAFHHSVLRVIRATSIPYDLLTNATSTPYRTASNKKLVPNCLNSYHCTKQIPYSPLLSSTPYYDTPYYEYSVLRVLRTASTPYDLLTSATSTPYRTTSSTPCCNQKLVPNCLNSYHCTNKYAVFTTDVRAVSRTNCEMCN